MENLISLINKIQRACTNLGDHGEASALPTLWDSLPAIAVVGDQSSGKSSCASRVLGTDFYPIFLTSFKRRQVVLESHHIIKKIDLFKVAKCNLGQLDDTFFLFFKTCVYFCNLRRL
ncbi:hypothetical protein UlMin_017709 [Ulmus minor]